MKEKVVPSAWLEKDGRRLDCGPYLSGAMEAKVILDGIPARKRPLQELTRDGLAGIFNGPRFSRSYVSDPRYGVPFLGSTDILAADLTRLPLLSRKQVSAAPRLLIEPGWTLITCSGTVGRMVYSRADMMGMAGSQHFMRVVPDTKKIRPGFLYAFLSSRFGLPLVIGGSYGALVQHIEPQHIANLPVPIAPTKIQESAHELAEDAAQKRSKALLELRALPEALLERLAIPPLSTSGDRNFGTSHVLASSLGLRLDATYHSTIALEAEEKIAKCNCLRSLKDVVVRMFKPPMFKRLWVSGPEFGRRFVSGESICRLRPTENQYVSTRTPQFSEFILKRGWLIFQAAGQVYGLFGQPIWVSGWLEEVFCADDVYRVVPVDEIDGAYLYVWFRTPHGRALLVRQASGNSIPRVWDPHMARVSVPWADRRVREEFGERVVSAHRMLEVAACNEDHAVKLVEAWLEKE